MKPLIYTTFLAVLLITSLGSGTTCNVYVGDIGVEVGADTANAALETGSDNGGREGGRRGPFKNTLEVVIAGQAYSYSRDCCSRTQGPGGYGSGIETAGDSGWPSDQPQLSLTAIFRGFRQEDGIPAGTTIDLSSADSADSVSVIFIVSEPDPGIVGGPEPIYAHYASTDGEFTGGEWVDGSSGEVVVDELTYYGFEDDPSKSPEWAVDVSLNQVILVKTGVSNEQPGQEVWPDQIVIESASLR